MCGLTLQSNATTYYCKPGGTGNHSSEANAGSLNGGIEKLVAGDVLILLDGTYNVYREQYVYQKGSVSGNYITIKAKNKHAAVIQGTSDYLSDCYAVFYLYGCKKIIVDGIIFRHASGSSDQVPGIRVSNGSDYVTVRNCQSYDNGGAGFTSEGSDHITFEDCLAYGNCKRNAINTSGFSMYRQKDISTNNNLYWGCIIQRCIAFNNQCNLKYKYNNESSDKPTDGNGIIIDYFDYDDASNNPYSKRTLVQNNLCFNNGGSGIKIFKSSKVRIINNTIYHNNRILKNWYTNTAELGIFENYGVGGVYNEGVYSNIVVADNNVSGNYAIIVENGASGVYDNHLVGAGAKSTNYNYSTANFPSDNVVKAVSNQTYPKFVSPGTNSSANFRLQSGSPLIGAFRDSYYASDDLDKRTRPVGTYSDIGAYENASGSREMSEEAKERAEFFGPNPATDYIRVGVVPGAGSAQVSISSITGMVMRASNEKVLDDQSSVDVNVSGLQKGMYLIKTTQAGKSYTRKMMKQ